MDGGVKRLTPPTALGQPGAVRTATRIPFGNGGEEGAMKMCSAVLVGLVVGIAAPAWADGELVYPWDNPPPAPGADCLDVPCVPCVFSLPGLSALRSDPKPCRVPEDSAEAPTVAAADISGETPAKSERR